MLINSIEFIMFLCALVVIYKIMPKKIKWIVLLIASYLFFALNSGKYTIFIVLSTISIYITALQIDKIGNNASIKAKSIENKEEIKIIKNRAKRSKSMFANPLDEIEGVGAKRKKQLLERFGSVKALQSASAVEIAEIKGISEDLAQTIYNALHNK